MDDGRLYSSTGGSPTQTGTEADFNSPWTDITGQYLLRTHFPHCDWNSLSSCKQKLAPGLSEGERFPSCNMEQLLWV